MGAFTSRAFTDLMEEVETPPQTPTGKKCVDFDPRSPTVGITRTPIQVEKTPDTIADPRSPTIGIARTPIMEDKFASKTIEADVHVPAPLTFDDDSLTETPDDSPIVHTPLPPLDMEDDMTATPEASPQITKTTDAISLDKDTPPLALKPKNLLRTKQLQQSSPSKKRQQKSGSRSPLTPVRVDTNSPRAIVQRKQVAKLGLMTRSGNTNTTPVQRMTKGSSSPVRFNSLDKENVIISH